MVLHLGFSVFSLSFSFPNMWLILENLSRKLKDFFKGLTLSSSGNVGGTSEIGESGMTGRQAVRKLLCLATASSFDRPLTGIKTWGRSFSGMRPRSMIWRLSALSFRRTSGRLATEGLGLSLSISGVAAASRRVVDCQRYHFNSLSEIRDKAPCVYLVFAFRLQ